MKKIALILLALLTVCKLEVTAQNTYITGNEKMPNHPRLLLMKGEEKKLLRSIKKDPIWRDIHKQLISGADSVVRLPLNEYSKPIKRLYVAYANFRNIFLMGYAYRMTGDMKYAERIEKEMLKAASFPNWNPSHYLDVAEMTAGMAIGYDWLYSVLSPESRKIIETAIIEKGIKPSFKKPYNWWESADHNWTQVCHSGVSYGALAIWDKNKELSVEVLNRALNKLQRPISKYGPDGAYPEGPGYWDFGTSWNIMLFGALDRIFKTNFGLDELPGFLQTGEFMLHTLTPSLRLFNYSDASSDTPSLSPAMFWFYNKTKNPAILYNQAQIYQRDGMKHLSRFAPAMIIWGASTSMTRPVKPAELFWKGNGRTPVACMRSDWNSREAAYLGVKLGSPSSGHAHMDAGSFIFESEGINWAFDMGGENYHSLETKGVQMWGSQRFDIYRYTNMTHNTLTFNERKQEVKGKAEIKSYSDRPEHMYVTSDLTPMYKGQVKAVERAFSLVDKKYAVIEDKIISLKQFTKMTWTLVTKAKATALSDKEMLLEQDGKKLYLVVEGVDKVLWNVKPAKSTYSFDSPNPGVSLVTFDYDLKQGAENNLRVYLLPQREVPASYHPVLTK